MKRAWIVVGALAVGGCDEKPTMSEERQKAVAAIAEQRRPEVEARFESIKAIGKDAQAAAKVTTREPLTQKLEGLEADRVDQKVVIGSVDAFVDPTYKGMLFPGYGFSVDVQRIDKILTGVDVTDSPPETYAANLSSFLDSTVAVVVRYHEEVKPKQLDDRHFSAGHVIGDAVLYDIASKRRIGAFPFEARQGDAADAKMLLGSFHRDITTAIDQELVAYAENKPGPASPGQAPDSPEALRDRLLDKAFRDTIIVGLVRHDLFDTASGCKLLLTVESNMYVAEDYASAGASGPVKKEIAEPLARAIDKPCDIVFQVAPKPAEAP
jgi:hypothetical protein